MEGSGGVHPALPAGLCRKPGGAGGSQQATQARPHPALLCTSLDRTGPLCPPLSFLRTPKVTGRSGVMVAEVGLCWPIAFSRPLGSRWDPCLHSWWPPQGPNGD